MTDESILITLAKLQSHMQSAKSLGNEEEAQAFAEKIQQLLTKYKLEMSDVQFAQIDREDPVRWHQITAEEYAAAGVPITRARSSWQEQIARGVGYGHFVQMVVSSGCNALSFVGRKQDTQVAAYMLLTLVRTANELADKAYDVRWAECRAAGDVTQARGFRKSFLAGFALRVSQRYVEAREKIEEENKSNETALLRLNSSNVAIQKYFKESKGVFSKAGHNSGPSNIDDAGFERGSRAGDEVNLKPNAVGGSKSNLRLKGGR